jgi:hypothetical protein
MEAELMAKIQNFIKRIIVKQGFRQALIEGHGETPQFERIYLSTEMLSGLQHVQDILYGLKNRLMLLFRTNLSSSDREASVWRVFTAEYGPDSPLTKSFDSEARSVQLRNFVDHYQRRV